MSAIKNSAIVNNKYFPQRQVFLFSLILIAYASVFVSHRINLLTADIGRHITNGKVFAEEGKIISTNYYSYTEPDYFVVNHHWGAGVLFYFIQKYTGFQGLSVFYVLVVLCAIFLFVAAALSVADSRLVFFIAVSSMPLIAYRTEVRPEGISFFFYRHIFLSACFVS